MSPKRLDRAAPPAVAGEFEVRFATSDAAQGWDELAQQAPTGLRRAFEAIRANPRARTNPDRHHRLKGTLKTGMWKGTSLEQWQYEVTGGGRIWFLIDDARGTAWVTYAGTGHPKATE
ncbi:hypothetical protein C5E45_11065 [Nocardia nova]|uniref:Type II toxin-antitoxin system RelE/ParE family toxin n=1 Tax=Nocardia nova TaxID=37330 RepID=A0A2S6AST4_9NOCA|nr:hypothetical protein [Nocardia nova]PPJ30138.1 hypothetical protein C5E41_09470 [Nocardia nova]PPJ38274.1 hypothetical protein C5E45_11065 [Nocardia nova]